MPELAKCLQLKHEDLRSDLRSPTDTTCRCRKMCLQTLKQGAEMSVFLDSYHQPGSGRVPASKIKIKLELKKGTCY